MSKWNFFRKNKKEDETEPEKIKEETKEETQQNKPIAEYHETLYSDDSKKKNKTNKTTSEKEYVWRNTDKIEKDIDTLHIEKAKKPSTEIDKKVDLLINKNKTKHRKPSNVIYVVSNPQPGQVKGDWAVRGHGKIYSHHRTKENAIKKAREIAKKREATVMVQNTDGTFSDGFKPRT